MREEKIRPNKCSLGNEKAQKKRKNVEGKKKETNRNIYAFSSQLILIYYMNKMFPYK